MVKQSEKDGDIVKGMGDVDGAHRKGSDAVDDEEDWMWIHSFKMGTC